MVALGPQVSPSPGLCPLQDVSIQDSHWAARAGSETFQVFQVMLPSFSLANNYLKGSLSGQSCVWGALEW